MQSLLESLPGVDWAHDQDVWAKGASEIALTAHLVMPQAQVDDTFLPH